MRLTVIYTTQLKAALGIASEAIDVADDITFAGLLAILSENHAEAFQNLVMDKEGHLLPSIIVCVDDQQVNPDDDARLSEGASVTFLSAISGG